MSRFFGNVGRTRLVNTDDVNEDEIIFHVQNVVKQLNSINRNHSTLVNHEQYFSNCGANPNLGYIMNLAGDAHSLLEVVKSLRDAAAALEKIMTRQTGHGYWVD
jgi:hypothetical protein